jgi:RimJ/RimL family protein N-acetyltransferase
MHLPLDPNMKIRFQPFQKEHFPLWEQWINVPHVKEVWFIEGYETADYIHQKIIGNGYDYPFVIVLNDQPIGYIVCCDLYAYRTICPAPKGNFTEESPGTFCMDLFIAETDFLNKGYGTEIVCAFTHYVFEHFHAHTLLIDPAETNLRAIRCYEKAGFAFVKKSFDGVTNCIIMKITNPNSN